MPPQYVVYTLEDSINTFFEEYPGSCRSDCDRRAEQVVGLPVIPVPIQGSFSYTVTSSGSDSGTVVQFRPGSHALDMEVATLAKKIHPEFVPKCIYEGAIGSPPLHVYAMERMPGIPFINWRAQGNNPIKTVISFAKFFAQSWHRAPPRPPYSVSMKRELEGRLDDLRRLPQRFAPAVARARVDLPQLFEPSYPFTLNHTDLSETNFLVNRNDGTVTGVIDWDNARVLPFGTSLWGVENVLGSMGRNGWRYRDDHDELEEKFWTTLYESIGTLTTEQKLSIRAARRVGILLRYGFRAGENMRVTREDDSSIRYLDGLVFSRIFS
ncbi:Protein kinase-like domain protein [Zalerion maritima]|uniref:Protein kinase-like domain protein n=1 Tax=Zalerion maritima TaxID=339359 RepID=A0AAD5RFY3_9PEZI|nr:Protein kinase-like domain protein [Zalerion maritima]